MSETGIDQETEKIILQWLEIQFKGFPLALASAKSEVQTCVKCPEYIYKLMMESDSTNKVLTCFKWAVRRGRIWQQFDVEQIQA